MPHAYPMMLDVTNRPILIVGGGNVAARKVHGLLAAGATSIRVVSPSFIDDFPSGARMLVSVYKPEQLDGVQIVFAATDRPEVNATIVRDAKEKGLLVCRADGEDDPGDFATPATFREGALTVTVSTAGNPALSAKVRDKLVKMIDRRWIALADAMQQLRPRILKEVSDPARRREIFRAMADEEALDVLTREGLDGLWKQINERRDTESQKK